jgi:hypothetical protein
MSKATGTRTASLHAGQVPVFQGRRLSRAAPLYELATFLQAAREGAYARSRTLEKRHRVCSIALRQALAPEGWQ